MFKCELSKKVNKKKTNNPRKLKEHCVQQRNKRKLGQETEHARRRKM